MITVVRITRSLEKIMSCEVLAAFPADVRNSLIAKFIVMGGEMVDVWLPPVEKPGTLNGYPVCQSRFFWKATPEWVKQNTLNEDAVFFCEHLLDLD